MADEHFPPTDFGRENTAADDAQTVVEKASERIKKTAENVGAIYQYSRKPGMPLRVLSNIAKEAPLGSLLAAFLLGVAFAWRNRN